MYQNDWVKKWAKYRPEKLAFREYESKRSWTWLEFDLVCNYLAHQLKNQYQVSKGSRIAVYSENSIEYVFLFFTCVKIGAVIVPLNFRLAPREIDILISDANPDVIFYQAKYKENVFELKSIKNKNILTSITEIESLCSNPEEIDEFVPDTEVDENDHIMILYTSGTTGLPKGAIITHKMLLWNSINTSMRLDIVSDDHTLTFAPFFHTGGWNVLLTPFVHRGASQTLLSGFDTDLILKLMEREKVTLMFGIPTMLQMMSDSNIFKNTELSSMRYFIVGGAPMPISLINIWHGKDIPIRQGYGLTEVGPNCFSLHQKDAIRKKGSIGFPNFYVEARVINESDKDCLAEDVGELWLKSPVVTPGYWQNEEATKETITDGWFHTGDMVTKDSEGYYYVVDRKKNLYISGGENVYPAEVEKFLYSIPDIKEVAIIGIPDEKWGEVGKAFIALRQNCEITEEQFFEFCKGDLAKYKIPKYVVFMEELPKGDTGKIDRKQLINL